MTCGLPCRATRIKRGGEDEYALNRFAPLLYDILSDMGAGRLSQDDFPYVKWVGVGGVFGRRRLAGKARIRGFRCAAYVNIICPKGSVGAGWYGRV